MTEIDLFDLQKHFFSIKYDAHDTDLEQHRIEAKTLGKSLENIAQLFDKADKIINGENRSLNLYVTATAEPGSLLVKFVADIIHPENAKAILTALQFIAPIGTAAGLGVFSALRKISGKEIIEVHTDDTKDSTDVILSDGEVLKLDDNVAELVISPAIRASVKQIVASPLADKLNPVFSIIYEETTEGFKLQAKDIEAIEAVKTTSMPPKIELFTITSAFEQVNFKGKTGWKVNFNGMSISAPIEDETFLSLIKANEQAFKKDDEFQIKIERTTYINDMLKEHYKYKIKNVSSAK